jgi:hypothetical protein
MKSDETLWRALGLAVQILEELADDLRPEDDIADMRRMLNGESTGRDEWVVTQAVATALAFRAISASRLPVASANLNNRIQEFRALFEAAARCNAWALGASFTTALDKLGATYEIDEG